MKQSKGHYLKCPNCKHVHEFDCIEDFIRYGKKRAVVECESCNEELDITDNEDGTYEVEVN